MNWFKYLLNDKPLSLYYEESPSLNNVRLMELKINEDGPILIARIELNDFPGNPPDKWEAECNKVQIMLEFIEINQLCISGWDTDNIVDINFEKKGSLVNVSLMGKTTKVHFQSSFIQLQKVSAYWDSVE